VVGPGRVRTASGVEDVETLLIGQVRPGDLLLVHAGTAIGRVEP
jgi:hydrogenase maturation factor